MALVAAKCTQCGGDITVDNTKEAGICKFCGTAFITEKAINNYNTYITNNNNFSGANINIVGGDIRNLLEIANNSLNGGNGNKAFEYSNKVLEIKIDSCEAWLIKMKSLEFIGTIGNPRVEEIIVCGNKAIEYAEENVKVQIEEEVYKYYLNRSLTLLQIATQKINDVAHIKKVFETYAVASAFTASDNTRKADSTMIDLSEGLSHNALILKLSVPVKKIENDSEYQSLVKAISNQYVLYSQGLTERLAIYGSKLLDSAVEARKTTLTSYKEGLNAEDKTNISESYISNRATKNGCYIATCVYGSYDCPQVWTLRRFRDYRLDKTWYGRVFIKCYYTVSPTLVKWFGGTKWFRYISKFMLDKMVSNLNDIGFEDTYYHDKY